MSPPSSRPSSPSPPPSSPSLAPRAPDQASDAAPASPPSPSSSNTSDAFEDAQPDTAAQGSKAASVLDGDEKSEAEAANGGRDVGERVDEGGDATGTALGGLEGVEGAGEATEHVDGAQDGADPAVDQQHQQQQASGLPSFASSSSLASTASTAPTLDPSHSTSSPPPPPPATLLKRTETPTLSAVPRDVLPSVGRSRPTSTASLASVSSSTYGGGGGLNAAVAANPNRLSLSLDDFDDEERGDGVSPLGASTSSHAGGAGKRPFSLSSEPETPSTSSAPHRPSSQLYSSSSPSRSRTSLHSLSLSSSHGPGGGSGGDPTNVGRENSPSLTEAVWRQSLGLSGGGGSAGSSPLGTPVGEAFGAGEGKGARGMMEIKLDGDEEVDGEEGVSTPREAATRTNGFSSSSGASSKVVHRKSLSDSLLLSPTAGGSDDEDDAADADESRDSFPPQGFPPPGSATKPSFSSLGPPPSGGAGRDRQPSIATPHALDGFLSHRASANLSSLQTTTTSSLAAGGLGSPGAGAAETPLSPGLKELQEKFGEVRRRETSASEGGGSGAKRESAGGEVDWDFWGRVMCDYEAVAREQPRELSRAIQKGIPPALRGMTWQLMAAAKSPALEQTYQSLLKQSSAHEKSIARDLSRTFPKHEYFAESVESGGVGQENLFNVVKAYSLYDDEVGYTQGLQFIVGPLLLNMPDEEAFCVLVRLMHAYDLRSHYTPNMPGLQLRLFQFDRLVEELLPGVFLHMLRQGVKSSMYASQWFLTLFGYRFPLELVSSVFDLVFAEGVEAVFRFAVALLKRNETQLCQLEFEDLIEFLKNGLFEVWAPDPEEKDKDPDALYKVNEFVRDALQVRITPLMLDQFGEEWASLCAQQTAHAAELDSLRKANLQLSLQVRQLEASLAQVNQEHVELVKQVVAGRLEREELEDELVKYKLAYADLAHLSAISRASTSPLQMRRQSELSIASSLNDDASSVTSSASNAPSTSTSMGGSALAGLGGVVGGAGRWFGVGAGGGATNGGGGGQRASSSAMSNRSASNRSENGAW
ncbi:hypothetical protein JCM6882_007975 [Rhodosporidiobolus microsporus]